MGDDGIVYHPMHNMSGPHSASLPSCARVLKLARCENDQEHRGACARYKCAGCTNIQTPAMTRVYPITAQLPVAEAMSSSLRDNHLGDEVGVVAVIIPACVFVFLHCVTLVTDGCKYLHSFYKLTIYY